MRGIRNTKNYQSVMVDTAAGNGAYGPVASNEQHLVLSGVQFRYPLDRPLNRFVKRSLDVVLSVAVIILVLSWLLPLLGLLVVLESRGGMFFKQRRGGKNNRVFVCIKLRTMAAHSGANSFQTAPDRRYITRVGAWLRKTNLDELPQFFNVLFGDMSLVGPRPHMLAHDAYYGRMLPNYRLRQAVKPGITGWAQINGYRGDITALYKMEQRVAHDYYYICHYSLWLDLKILALTLFHRRGYQNAI
jgi:putative colanic acid biosysnthesis UDP-glucose lipid carrier transferase